MRRRGRRPPWPCCRASACFAIRRMADRPRDSGRGVWAGNLGRHCQDHGMGRLNHVWKSRLLLGAAALALIGAGAPLSARAQIFARTQSPPALPEGPADQAIGKGFYMEADTMIRDVEHHTWTAKGSVEARNEGKIL